jgi:hypothetical protein
MNFLATMIDERDCCHQPFILIKDELLKIDPITLSPKYQPDGKLSEERAKEFIDFK